MVSQVTSAQSLRKYTKVISAVVFSQFKSNLQLTVMDERGLNH